MEQNISLDRTMYCYYCSLLLLKAGMKPSIKIKDVEEIVQTSVKKKIFPQEI